jgi:hypothetical protein
MNPARNGAFAGTARAADECGGSVGLSRQHGQPSLAGWNEVHHFHNSQRLLTQRETIVKLDLRPV